jgi:hypothetical protein
MVTRSICPHSLFVSAALTVTRERWMQEAKMAAADDRTDGLARWVLIVVLLCVGVVLICASVLTHDYWVPAVFGSLALGLVATIACQGGIEFVVRFIFDMVFFGLIGAFFSSWFPIGLGLFLFFTNDEFIEWVLQKIGIRLVPHTLGSTFIRAFVFFTGLGALLAYWKESVPEWLSPWMPPTASWSLIGGVALLVAVATTISTAVIRKLLPRLGIEITPTGLGWATIEALIGLGMLGMLALLASTSMVSDWLGGH